MKFEDYMKAMGEIDLLPKHIPEIDYYARGAALGYLLDGARKDKDISHEQFIEIYDESRKVEV